MGITAVTLICAVIGGFIIGCIVSMVVTWWKLRALRDWEASVHEDRAINDGT